MFLLIPQAELKGLPPFGEPAYLPLLPQVSHLGSEAHSLILIVLKMRGNVKDETEDGAGTGT